MALTPQQHQAETKLQREVASARSQLANSIVEQELATAKANGEYMDMMDVRDRLMSLSIEMRSGRFGIC